MILAVDTETTGTDFFHGCRPFMVTACDGEWNYYWEGKVNPYTRDVYWDDEVLEEVQHYLDKAEKLVFHNTVFDMLALYFIGIKVDHLWDKIHDTLLASHCLCSGDVHGLKDLGIKYLDYWNDDEDRLESKVKEMRPIREQEGWAIAREGHPHFPALKSGARNSWWKMDFWLAPEECRQYGCCDAERTWLLWGAFFVGMKEEQLWDVYRVRRQLLEIYFQMRLNGMYFYKKEAQDQLKQLEGEIEELRVSIAREAGIKYHFDPNKRNHLVDLLYYKLNLDVINETDSGLPSTNKDTLDLLGEIYSDVKGISLLAKWRKKNKQYGALDSYIKWCDENNRIHSSQNITGTRETRSSSSDPNQQNIDKKLRHFFGPPPGYVWIDIDLVNIELRIWAYLVGNKELIEAFEKGESVHLIIFSVLYPQLYNSYIKKYGKSEGEEKIKDIEGEKYTKTKNGNFSRIYGATDRKSDKTYGLKGACRAIGKRFPEIDKQIQGAGREVVTNIEERQFCSVFTLGGYKLDVPPDEIFKACNYKIQGTAGFIMNLIMIAVWNSPIFKKMGIKMISQVHDSLIIEIPEHKHLKSTIDGLIAEMESAGQKLIPTSPVSYKLIESREEELESV